MEGNGFDVNAFEVIFGHPNFYNLVVYFEISSQRHCILNYKILTHLIYHPNLLTWIFFVQRISKFFTYQSKNDDNV